MKITEVTIEGFRGFNRRATINTDAQITLLYGDNGSCKTSLFDAIEWCLFGNIERLNEVQDTRVTDPVRNLFTKRSPYVSLKLALEEDEPITISREALTFGDSHVSVSTDHGLFENVDAERKIRGIIPLELYVTLAYLAQETLSSFIRDSPEQRFDITSKIFGLEKISSFYRTLVQEIEKLELQRTSRVSRLREMEARVQGEKESVEKRIASLTIRLQDNQDNKSLDEMSREWNTAIREAALQIGQQVLVSEFSIDTLERDLTDVRRLSSGLQESIKTIGKKRHEIETFISNLPQLRMEVGILKNLRDSETELQSNRAQIKRQIRKRQADINTIREKANEIHNRKEAQEAQVDKSQRFLELARDFVVGKTCPICGQTISKSHVQKKLAAEIGAVSSKFDSLRKQEKDTLSELRAEELELRNLKRELAQKENEIKDIAERMLQSESKLAQYPQLTQTNLTQSLDVELASDELHRELEPLDEQLLRIKSILNVIERIESVLDLRDAKTKFEDIAKANTTEQLAIAEIKRSVAKIDEIVDVLKTSEKISREQELDAVKESFDRYKSLLNEMFKRLEPHPLFQDLLVRPEQKEDVGRIYFDVKYREFTANAQIVLSQAQLNVVALCIFLALNVANKEGEYPILLDDPVQNMDELNAMALADIMKYLCKDKQVILATHDRTFFEMISERLRPASSDQRRLVHIFKVGDTSGPDIQSGSLEFVENPSIKVFTRVHGV